MNTAKLRESIDDISAGLTAIEALTAYEISEAELIRSTQFIVQRLRGELQKIEAEITA